MPQWFMNLTFAVIVLIAYQAIGELGTRLSALEDMILPVLQDDAPIEKTYYYNTEPSIELET